MNSLVRCAARGRRDGARYALTAAACALANMSVHAGDVSVGVGAGIDHGKTDCVAALACDHGSAHAKLFVGYAPADNIELQALAFDAGHFDGGDTTSLGTPFGGRFKVSGLGIAAGYRWSLAPDWSLKAQGGIARVRTRFDYAAPFSGEQSKTSTEPLLGLSLAWRAAPNVQLSLDYDQTRFEADTRHGSLRMLGLAAQFSF